MRLTVVQTLPALEAGGVERGTVEVAAALVRAGHRSIVISAGGRLLAPLLEAGSEHINIPIGKKSPLTARHIFSLRKLLLEQQVDVLHARSRLPAWIARLAWQSLPPATRPRFITSVHGPYSVNAYSRIMLVGEAVIAISQFIRRYIVANYPACDPGKIVVIPRGVSAAEFPHGHQPVPAWLIRWQQAHPDLKGKFILTLPARLTRWKGQEDFIDIVGRLKAAAVPVHGLMAGRAAPGKAAFSEALKRRVQAAGLGKSIRFLGQRDDLREVMAVSNVVVSLAREPEAFGRTALEALSLGIPVVAYDHGGASEVLQQIFPAGLVPPLDTAAAAERIRAFYAAPPTVAPQDVFTLERMLSRTLAVYEKSAGR